MGADLKTILETRFETAFNFLFHKKHALQARGILKSIEGHQGKTNPAIINQADAYAREVLGGAHFAPWLYVYAAVAGEFREGWIPDNFYGNLIVPRMNGRYGLVSFLKPLSRKMIVSDAFPDVGYFVNGLFLDIHYQVLPVVSTVKAVLFANTDKVVFKVDHSKQGKAVFIFTPQDFDVDKIRQLGNGVFQNFIQQHSLFSGFVANAVATLRITSVVTDAGEISVRSCYLRFGRSADTHVQSASHVRVPVDVATGTMAAEGFMTNWLRIPQHPDSGLAFAGVQVPAYSRAIGTVVELHRQMPMVRCVGWDIAIDVNDNVQVMEWNGEHNDIKFSEATQGPCFADMGWEKIRPRTGK